MSQTENRLKKLRTVMAETGTDLVVLGPGAHMHWLLGFHPHGDERPCLLMIGREREMFLMPALNAEGTREETDIAFCEWSDDQGPDAALAQALDRIGVSGGIKVVLDETMRADFALLVLGALPGARHDFTVDTVGALRMRKDDAEFAKLKENALIDDRAMQAGLAALKPGVTELEVADAIRAEFVRQGAKPEFTIVGSGPNGAFPHHATGNRKLETGDAVVIDIGGRKDGFPSDMTRMAVIGHAPEGYEEVHAIVERAVQAAMAAARPGVRAMDVDAAARNVIAEAGYGEYFVHRLGHGLGIEVHEPPYLTSTSETVLDEGMVFSIEPGIYLPGRFGLRLEDIVILRADGPEVLSSLPRDVHVAGK
ncbi:Xaa-Pro aminopeptidase [Hoeflea halophila]|uniref:Xaa-Pro aminopeptidase n=1 Tax=Hoeflea halophila TaxID=714899 RepID=A0A286I943_9HYPH|nr:Xaa-Pro peptidase family protein [Hoeflea halophila]SOE16582.1 Xaa-Pro aminopeptidase [Hoeflea halophila]